MSKVGLDLKDFSIALRKQEAKLERPPESPVASQPSLVEKSATKMLPKPSAEERQEVAEARALSQQDVSYSLKNLKRSKQRSVKFFINIALDYELKARLQRASQENDLKMTQVVKAALDYYLKENGY
ncbi:hypothetical protein [Neorhizobium galegae]|uniref:hypothetical protein n=1 Tax=Neorhizobium galegae TaxID=399 RepID=UPI000620E7D1|nr:hypothetical protein [Neorhizobium galegae]CDZ55598.1 Hypothetical protein NGAL_HAMBI2427_62910 [Neorhizobium galegae bv. orientalis]